MLKEVLNIVFMFIEIVCSPEIQSRQCLLIINSWLLEQSFATSSLPSWLNKAKHQLFVNRVTRSSNGACFIFQQLQIKLLWEPSFLLVICYSLILPVGIFLWISTGKLGETVLCWVENVFPLEYFNFNSKYIIISLFPFLSSFQLLSCPSLPLKFITLCSLAVIIVKT